jgi:hypothetical protein
MFDELSPDLVLLGFREPEPLAVLRPKTDVASPVPGASFNGRMNPPLRHAADADGGVGVLAAPVDAPLGRQAIYR